MSDLAALADEVERRVRELGRSPGPNDSAMSLGYYVAGQAQALLSALRASRPEPEPAADVVEAVAEALFQVDWDELCAIEDCRRVAGRLLSALPSRATKGDAS